MDTVHQLADDFLMTTQIQPNDFAAIGELGVATVINLRPDSEGHDQPASEAIGREAASYGMDYHHIPIRPGEVEDHHVDSFAAIMEEASRRVLGFCGSGKRVITIWALLAAERSSVDEVLAWAAECGYDISPLRERLIARQGAR